MKNKKLFDKYRDGNHWEKHPTIYAERFLLFLKNEVDPESYPEIIVDLGCGNGRDVDYFIAHGMNARGFDNDVKVIAGARKKFPKHATSFCLQNIHYLKTSKIRQAYYCVNVMHYVNPKKVLMQIHETLKPGGYAFIHFNLKIIDNNGLLDYYQKKSDVYKLLGALRIVAENHFSREDSTPVPHTHHIMQVILQKPKKKRKKI